MAFLCANEEFELNAWPFSGSDRLDCCLEQFLVHYVGSGDYCRKWSAVLLDQDRLLGAVLGAVGGVLSLRFPRQIELCRVDRLLLASANRLRRGRRIPPTRRPKPFRRRRCGTIAGTSDEPSYRRRNAWEIDQYSSSER